MLLLAVETATDAAAVALADDEGVVASVVVERGRRHGETLAPAIDFACRSVGVRPAQVEAVAVDVGPGLFTGLRVGLATAKAFAAALDLPVVAVGSLQVLASAAAETGLVAGWSGAAPVGEAGRPGAAPVGETAGRTADVVAVVDARRGEVFWAPFRVDRSGSEGGGLPVEATGPEAVCPPDVLAGLLPPCSLTVGDGAARYAAVLSAAGHQVAGALLHHPPVTVLARLGVRLVAAGAAGPASAVAPRYLRHADVRINWEQRLPARPAPR